MHVRSTNLDLQVCIATLKILYKIFCTIIIGFTNISELSLSSSHKGNCLFRIHKIQALKDQALPQNSGLSSFLRFFNTDFQVALLKEAASKKDAEISNLQTFKERFERGESALGLEKPKSRPSKPTARSRASIDLTAAQKVRMVQNEVVNGGVEVCSLLYRYVSIKVRSTGHLRNVWMDEVFVADVVGYKDNSEFR